MYNTTLDADLIRKIKILAAQLEKRQNDLLKKTIGFYEFTKKRLNDELGTLTRFLPAHFNARFNINKDLYEEAMEKNIQYLKHILENHEDNYRDKLRRGNFVNKLEGPAT